MLSDTVKSRLAERFAADTCPNSINAASSWHDDDGEFADAVDELALSGVTAVKLAGKNNFAVKKLLTADGLTGGYLVYDPLACKKEGLLKFAIIGYNP